MSTRASSGPLALEAEMNGYRWLAERVGRSKSPEVKPRVPRFKLLPAGGSDRNRTGPGLVAREHNLIVPPPERRSLVPRSQP